MDAKEKYKEETGEEWDSIGYPTMGYTDWLECKFNNVSGCHFCTDHCKCEEPDREDGFSYCHKCYRHVSDERLTTDRDKVEALINHLEPKFKDD